MKNIGYIFLLSIILFSSCVRDEIETLSAAASQHHGERQELFQCG